MLHRAALGQRWLAEASFDLEQATQRIDGESIADGRHLFIAGFARAGTTMLLNRLADTGEFASLTYADMPFVLMPGLWRKISGARQASELKERAHGDGVLVNEQSPEALEEVYWRIFHGKSYLREEGVTLMRAEGEAIGRFRSYIAAVLQAKGAQRYLSKNNNNILRLPTIAEAFPSADLLAPFRDPLQHACSIHRQHERFLIKEREDPFVRQYMDWLGHHEFGGGHRLFRIGGEPPSQYAPAQLEYWLEQWRGVYRHLLKLDLPNLRFLGYEWLCEREENWNRVARELRLPTDSTGMTFNLRTHRFEKLPDSDLLASCQELYLALVERMHHDWNR